MSPIKFSFVLFLGLLCCALVLGQRGGYGRGRGMGGGYRSGAGFGGGVGRGGAYIGAGIGGGRGGRRYRSTLYNDEDVYGYEANYPGGEAMYVNYRSSEARAKRAEDFARSSPYSSSAGSGPSGGQSYQEQGGRNERNADYDQMW